MKKKSFWITAAIIGLCVIAVIFALARAWTYRPILIEGTITDEQGNAMNGVTAYVSFLQRKTMVWHPGSNTLEETVDSSFRFEGNGDRIFVTFARKGYAPRGLLLNRDDSDLIQRDLRIVMKKTTPEELEKNLFRAFYQWSSFDHIEIGEIQPTTEDRLEQFRKAYVLEKSDMTNVFTKTIQDHFSVLEKKPENKKPEDLFYYAISSLRYYPPPQKEFMELIQKTSEWEPELVETVISGYISAYPDWFFDDKPIIEIIDKTNSKTNRLYSVCADLINQIRKEKNEVRKKKLLDKAFEWAFQDDKLELFCFLDRILLDHYEKEYATNPGRKLQLEKDLKRYEEARNYDWVYRRTKYALEHFGEEDESLEMLYKMDTDPKLKDGEWERSERKRRNREHIEEMKKAGKDPRSVYSKEYLEELYRDE